MAMKMLNAAFAAFFICLSAFEVSAQCNSYIVEAAVDDYYGSCVCDIQVAAISGCTNPPTQAELDQLAYIQHRVANISARIVVLKVDVETITVEIEITQADLDEMTMKLERIESGDLKVNQPEFDLIIEEISKLEQVLVLLEADRVAQLEIIVQLEAELAAVEQLLFGLKKTLDVGTLLEEIEELEEELAQCKADVKPTQPPGTGDDKLFIPWDDEGTQDSCTPISHVSTPYTVRTSSSENGAWMRDPAVDSDKIWHYEYHTSCTTSTDYRIIHQFLTYSSYEHDVSFSQSKQFNFAALSPYRVYGPGIAVYKGSIYYSYGTTMYRYNVASNTYVTSKTLTGAGSGSSSHYEYMTGTGKYGGCSAIEFAVDENGLWVIWSSTSAGYPMMISRLNEETLDIIQTWNTNTQKKNYGNCFIVCGKLHCIDSYQGMDTEISFIFDTATGHASVSEIQLGIRFGELYTLSYNPRDQKLYGWDNGKMVLYDLTFKGN